MKKQEGKTMTRADELRIKLEQIRAANAAKAADKATATYYSNLGISYTNAGRMYDRRGNEIK
mgnify:CR=1 FL=1